MVAKLIKCYQYSCKIALETCQQGNIFFILTFLSFKTCRRFLYQIGVPRLVKIKVRSARRVAGRGAMWVEVACVEGGWGCTGLGFDRVGTLGVLGMDLCGRELGMA